MLENYELTKENYQKCLFEKFFLNLKLLINNNDNDKRLDVKSTLESRTREGFESLEYHQQN